MNIIQRHNQEEEVWNKIYPEINEYQKILDEYNYKFGTDFYIRRCTEPYPQKGYEIELYYLSIDESWIEDMYINNDTLVAVTTDTIYYITKYDLAQAYRAS